MKTGEKQTEQVNNNQLSQAANINRKEALVKAGKYTAFTALGMMVLLSPKKTQAQSLPGSLGGFPGF
jgi:hypothetical protein